MRLSKTLPLLIALLPLVAVPVTRAEAPALDPSALAQAKRRLQAGVTHASAEEVHAARGALAALASGSPADPVAAYWLALADWRAAPLAKDADEGRKECREGIAACDRALASRPKFAEAIAIKASLQGLSLTWLPSSAGMSLGPEMDEALARARALEPDNPRVALLEGIQLLHKPEAVGGGATRAKAALERAVALFEAAPARDSTAIDWGREDAYVWSGQCLARLGDWSAAAARYRRALAIEPEHAWTRMVLLPEAEKHLAEAGAK